jgi:UDP-N-acetylglucosamine transferase subunit ALG13
MILVLLGTQPQPFNRLIVELIAMEEAHVFGQTEIVIQAGHTKVDDPRFVVFDFIPQDELDTLVAQADVVITHGGAGSIFSALHQRKKVIALARSGALGEHVDEHQAELVAELYKDGYIIGTDHLQTSYDLLSTFSFKRYESSRDKIVQTLESWLGIS